MRTKCHEMNRPSAEEIHDEVQRSSDAASRKPGDDAADAATGDAGRRNDAEKISQKRKSGRNEIIKSVAKFDGAKRC